MARNEVRVSSRRTLILLGAVGLGLLAAFFLYTYVNGLEDDIKADIQPVQVVVAAESIPTGTPGEVAVDDVLVQISEIPRENLPDNAVSNTDSLNGKVALFDIPKNLPITTDMFVRPDQAQISFRQRLQEPEWVTVTVNVDEVAGVAGLLVPGDEVNIMVEVGFEDPEEVLGAQGTPVDPANPLLVVAPRYEMLYQKVHIIAVGRTTQQLPGESVDESETGSSTREDTGLITFNVPPEAAQYIATFAYGDIENSGVYLSLVPVDYEPEPVPAPPLGVEELPGQNPDILTPYGPDDTGRGE
jgi:Flp pilus assembly protein CpaB